MTETPPAKSRGRSFTVFQWKSIASSLVLTSSFGLLLPLETRADIMLSLLDLGDHAVLGAAALEALQSTLQRLVLFDANFRHRFPSLRRIRLNPGCFQGRYNGNNYYSQSSPKSQAISYKFFGLFRDSANLYRRWAEKFSGESTFLRRIVYFTIRLTSLFLTTMLLTMLPPCFSRKRAIFSSAVAAAITASLSRSAATWMVPRSFPLT